MYAIVELQGEQLRVEENDTFTVNRMAHDGKKPYKIGKVLFGKKGDDHFIGQPYVKGAYVECDVLGDKRGKKVLSFKYRQRKSSQSLRGHRQDLTELKVKKIHLTASGNIE